MKNKTGNQPDKNPNKWIAANLGDVCEIQGGYAFKSKDYLESGIPLLRISNINDQRVSFEKDTVYLSKSFLQDNQNFLVKRGDILVALSGATTGKYGEYKLDTISLLNQRVGRIRCHSSELTNYKYLFHFLEIIKQDILKQAYGAAQPNISITDLNNFQIPFAPLSEQNRIVAKIEELFTKLDAGVGGLKKVKVQLNRYRQAVLKSAFEGKLTEEWRGQNKNKIEDAKFFLDKVMKENSSSKIKSKEKTYNDLNVEKSLPEGWVWARIGDISEVGTGLTPLKSNSEFYENGKIPWVISGALNKEFVTEPSLFVTTKAVNETRLKLYPKNTLLVALYGEGKTRGKCSELLFESTINQAIAAIVLKGLAKSIRPFLKLFLIKNYNEIRLMSSGGVQPNLNLSIIKQTLFPLPSLLEQNKIIQEVDFRLSIVEKIEKIINENIKKSTNTKNRILKKSFHSWT